MRVLPSLALVLAVGCGQRAADTNPQSPDPAPGPGQTGGPAAGPAAPEGKTFVNSLPMEFVLVPKGGEVPQDFYLGTYEVTQEQWQAVTGKNPSAFSPAGGNAKAVAGIPPEDLKRFPVERVSWPDAQQFLSLLAAKAPVPGWRYRLPTEAEWKYACRGGEPRQEKILFAYYFRDGITDQLTVQKANFGSPVLPGRKTTPGSLGRTCKVGRYEPNRLGLYDMHGNVWEWSQDRQGNFKTAHLRLGGGYTSEAHNCAASQSYGFDDTNRSADQGLRVALVRAP